ncbi:glutaredoxin family protein [Mycolicibacterium llatzerense]|uniref:glutaredoxin family protein n=1 Tax=Mycolicibacterium llatzerense TaxID=280871 RepID=UPI0021B6366E|nr:glutaredoxin family protein [Mycolicibacterium llatzerense]
MIVTVYSAGPSCMACRQTKRHLDKRGIPFTEVQIDETISEAAQFLGLRTAPIVCVSRPEGETYWDGYRPDSIDALTTATTTTGETA